MLERYRMVNGRKLRCGYTTGSCAAGAAKGAALILLGCIDVKQVTLLLSHEIELCLELEDKTVGEDFVRCAVRKDAGDDKDVTNGILIYATVRKCFKKGIWIDGGKGIGRVTKKGLNQPIGEAAINSVPRKMIREAVQSVCEEMDYEGGLSIQIEVPEGEKIAEKTFNPRLGIIGGISILGTTGIVEPMSEQALLDTIRTEIHVRKEAGEKSLLVTPGNYGLDYVRGKTALSSEYAVKCSNFIGDTIDMAVEEGFQNFLLVGHIGKLVKVGAGIMNTHSRIADGRMETLAVCGVEAGISIEYLQKILICNTTDEAIDFLKQNQFLSIVMERLMVRIEQQMTLRAGKEMKIAGIVFSNQHGLLGKTSKAEELLIQIQEEFEERRK